MYRTGAILQCTAHTNRSHNQSIHPRPSWTLLQLRKLRIFNNNNWYIVRAYFTLCMSCQNKALWQWLPVVMCYPVSTCSKWKSPGSSAGSKLQNPHCPPWSQQSAPHVRGCAPPLAPSKTRAYPHSPVGCRGGETSACCNITYADSVQNHNHCWAGLTRNSILCRDDWLWLLHLKICTYAAQPTGHEVSCVVLSSCISWWVCPNYSVPNFHPLSNLMLCWWSEMSRWTSSHRQSCSRNAKLAMFAQHSY